MTKDEARSELLKRWRELPAANRQTYKEALAFAELMVKYIDFETLANKQRVLESWLVRDLLEGNPEALDAETWPVLKAA